MACLNYIFPNQNQFKATFIWLLMAIQKSVAFILIIFLAANLVHANEIFVNPVLEGNLLNNDSSDQTIFNYSIGSGTINIYNVRNSTTGIYKNGAFSIITFSTIESGNSYINLSNVIWANSTIT